MDILTCGTCQAQFPLADITLFIQHKKQDCTEDFDRRISSSQSGLVCTSCSRNFRRAWDLLRHVQHAHSLKLFEEKACDDRILLREDDIADHTVPASSAPYDCSPCDTYLKKGSDTDDYCLNAQEDNIRKSNSNFQDGSVSSPHGPQTVENDFQEQEIVPLDLKMSSRRHEVTSVSSACPSDSETWANSPSSLYSPCSIDNSPKSKHISTIPKKRKWTHLVQDDDQMYLSRSNVSTCTSPDACSRTSPDMGLRAIVDASHKGSSYDICEKADDQKHVPPLPIAPEWKYSHFAKLRENSQIVQREDSVSLPTSTSNRSESPKKSSQIVQQRNGRGGHSDIPPRYMEFVQHEQYNLKSEDSPGVYTSSQLDTFRQYSFPAQIRNDYPYTKLVNSNAVPKSPDSSGLAEHGLTQDHNHQNDSNFLLTDLHGFGKKRRYPTSRPFKCDHCDHSFNQRIHLKKHLSKHTGVKPFKCGLCDYSTVERSHLKVHIRIHTGEKPFGCTFCDYATAQNSTLKIHLKRHHDGKMFECRECRKCFTQVNMLDSHMRIHHCAPSSDQISSVAVSAHEFPSPSSCRSERPLAVENRSNMLSA